MAEPHYVLSPLAAADLHAIEDYIAERSGNARAELVIDRIYRSLANLSYLPRSGRAAMRRELGLRTFSISPWLVLYEILPGFDGVHVLRVVDGRRDLETLFQGYR
jgi:plasmid stabilization system protein ParE